MGLMLIRGIVSVSWMRLSGLRNPGIFHQQVSLFLRHTAVDACVNGV